MAGTLTRLNNSIPPKAGAGGSKIALRIKIVAAKNIHLQVVDFKEVPKKFDSLQLENTSV